MYCKRNPKSAAISLPLTEIISFIRIDLKEVGACNSGI